MTPLFFDAGKEVTRTSKFTLSPTRIFQGRRDNKSWVAGNQYLGRVRWHVIIPYEGHIEVDGVGNVTNILIQKVTLRDTGNNVFFDCTGEVYTKSSYRNAPNLPELMYSMPKSNPSSSFTPPSVLNG